jgi:putative NIF3 family GTP cyclohydrolase 1 type 2
MLDNATDKGHIDRVYLTVFPGQDELDTVIAREVERGAPGALVFTHHPLAYSEREAAFSTIPTAQLEEFQEHNISLYSCHAPLDCHPETSTTTALAEALGLEEQSRFGKYYAGLAGIHGRLSATTFQAFAELLAEVCELLGLRYDQCRHNGQAVEHVAVIPGGGNDPEMIDEAIALGVDTFITGQWWLFGKSEFAATDRHTMRDYLANTNLNLLGASHYSSELVVMRDFMPDWFREHNVDTVLLRQDDPWQ